jgi:hypothetical protein
MSRHQLSIGIGLRHHRSCAYDDFFINKKRLSDILKVRDPITPFGWLGTTQVPRADLEDCFARMLLGSAPSDLRADRIPLFICGECADYGCGAITCTVTLSDTMVEWSDFGWDVTYEEETNRLDDLLSHHFYFDRVSYEAVFQRYTIKANKPAHPTAGYVSI